MDAGEGFNGPILAPNYNVSSGMQISGNNPGDGGTIVITNQTTNIIGGNISITGGPAVAGRSYGY